MDFITYWRNLNYLDIMEIRTRANWTSADINPRNELNAQFYLVEAHNYMQKMYERGVPLLNSSVMGYFRHKRGLGIGTVRCDDPSCLL